MGGLLKRYRELILVIVLLVVPLGVYFANAKHATERSRFDQKIVAITAPIEKATGWAIVKALDIWNGYVALRHSHERAVALQRAVNSLELDRLELQKVRQENERLRRLLGFADEVSGREVVGGRIIGVRLDPKGLQIITVDRGANEGIERMMPVVVGQGVVGRVHSVTPATADILLLTDRNSSIAVLVDRSRARANVRGTGSPDACRLEYALRSDDMIEGDQLVTSGTDGVFPRGLPVGTLIGLKRRGQGLYQRADVKPAVDVTKLEEVLIVTAFDRNVEEPPPAAPPAQAAAQGAGPAASAAKASAPASSAAKAAAPGPKAATAHAKRAPAPARASSATSAKPDSPSVYRPAPPAAQRSAPPQAAMTPPRAAGAPSGTTP